jgi:hypothetical protein
MARAIEAAAATPAGHALQSHIPRTALLQRQQSLVQHGAAVHTPHRYSSTLAVTSADSSLAFAVPGCASTGLMRGCNYTALQPGVRSALSAAVSLSYRLQQQLQLEAPLLSTTPAPVQVQRLRTGAPASFALSAQRTLSFSGHACQ